MKKCGIYLITNRISGDRYIGSSIDIHKRWKNHKHLLNANKHANSHMQRSWNKYTRLAFTFEILELSQFDTLIEREIFWIETINPEFNKSLPNLDQQGWIMSEESKKALSDSVSRYHKNNPPTDEFKKKCSDNHPWKGKTRPERTRSAKQQSEDLCRLYKTITKSLKSLAKFHLISQKIFGQSAKILTDEHKAKMALGRFGRVLTGEHRESISKSKMGHPVSDVTKQKLQDYWKNRKKSFDNTDSQ